MNSDIQKKANSTAFTLRANNICNVLKTNIQIFSPNGEKIIYENAEGIWDTGASASVISRQLANVLNLVPVSYGYSNTANGKMPTAIYYLSLGLPNGVLIPNLRISDGNLPCDMLIGMDVITRGDFHISNQGKTVLTFEIPSTDERDYVKDINLARACATKANTSKRKKK